jgi:hypothetical protein
VNYSPRSSTGGRDSGKGSPALPHTLKGQQSEISNLSILSRMTNIKFFFFFFFLSGIGRISTVKRIG